MDSGDAVIVEAVRVPIGRRLGGLASIHPVDLSALVLNAVVDRAGLDPATVDDVVWGCVLQISDQSVNVGRNAVLAAGWPNTVPATTVDRQCGSGQQAVHFAAAGIVAGQYDVAIAGGVESMSRVPLGSTRVGGDPLSDAVKSRFGVDRFHQGEAAEWIAAHWGLSRSELDEYALGSHTRATEASTHGCFDSQLVTDGLALTVDEGIRPDTSIEKLSALRPAYREDGVITAGNSSQISDSAAALLLTSAAAARRLQLRPIARIHTAVVVGDDPVSMLTGPIPAVRKALARSGLSMKDIGVFEINEAFASVVLAWMRELGAEPEVVNPLGGAISMGHPLGASGAILMTRMVHHMRDRGIRYGIQSMCEGGGLANATVLELL